MRQQECEKGSRIQQRVEKGDSSLRAEEGVVDMAELEAGKGASGLEDAVGLLEDVGDGSAVPDAERDGAEVVRVRGELGLGHRLRVRFLERYLRSYTRKIQVWVSTRVCSSKRTRETYCCGT